jgi:PleD family two-component response regulator
LNLWKKKHPEIDKEKWAPALDHDILRQDKQGQPTVLVVDDDPGQQDLFRTFLKQIGFSRVVVGTATEAIKSLRKQKFDLMFLDLQLPDAPSDQVHKSSQANRSGPQRYRDHRLPGEGDPRSDSSS